MEVDVVARTARAAVFEAPHEPFVMREYPLKPAGAGLSAFAE